MSVNALRVKLKKLRGNDKKPEKQGPKLPKDAGKRKALSTGTCSVPETSGTAANTTQVRKSSLGSDSPLHTSVSRVPTSPLVVTSSTQSMRRESNHSLPGIGPQPPSVPKVNISFNDDQPLDRQGIINITVDVQNFLANISRLRKAMEEADASEEDTSHLHVEPDLDSSTAVMTNLTDLIQVVHTCLGQHQGMQSTEIKDAAKNLMNSYQNCNHRNASTCGACNGAIETLIDAFTNSVQEYLTGECVPQEPHQPPQEYRRLPRGGFSSTNLLKGFSKSHENLASRYSSCIDLSQQTFNEPIVDQIDQALSGIENAIDTAARYIKVRTKYHREITAYLAKRAQIEARYQQHVTKLAKSTRIALDELQTQEECLPLLDLFRASVDQDMRFATNCNTTYNFQVGNKLIDPLDQKIIECERLKKDLTQTWQRELKKLAEARAAMKNAKTKYRFLVSEVSRVKNLLAADPYGKQAEKRKKEVTDLEAKFQEAETTYKSSVAECNDCQYQVHVAAQKSILCAYRRMVIDVDVVLKSGLENYFQLQHNFFMSLPEPMHKNVQDSREYEVGTDFMRYIQRHPQQSEEPEDYLFEEYDPDTDILPGTMESPESMTDLTRLPNSTSSDSPFLSAEDPVHRTERAASPIPQQAWDTTTTSLNDSRSSSLSTHSPRTAKRTKTRPRSMAFLIDPNFESPKSTLTRRNSDTQQDGGIMSPPPPPLPADSEDLVQSKNALTHNFKKLRGPARCRECDTYVYFHGFECEVCGLACHKKCMATLAIRCGSKRLARKMNTFGVDFLKHLRATKRYIPIIVTKCITEIEDRGLDSMGLYRISSAKTKIEHLCQLFESGADRVDLSDRPPHLIGSCLKLYFRQLPEPLLTFGLYHEFISFAREASILPCVMETASEEKAAQASQLLQRLTGLLQKLPYENYITLARLLYHLNRVGSPDHVIYNRMPPSNLGIVFGPNLLRQREMVASLALLADMTAQAKCIEILISHVQDVFHVSEEQVIREHEQEYDDSETTEMLVGEGTELVISSPQLDVDDAQTAGSRTPYNTPPERRRENVSELGEVLETLQSVGSLRRTSAHLKPNEHPKFHIELPGPALPGTIGSEDMLTVLHKYLRPQTIFEKTLTPVEERTGESSEETNKSSGFSEDDDDHIVTSDSPKLDQLFLSRSASGLSNPSIGVESEISSNRDLESSGLGILGGGFGTPSRRILSQSLDNMLDSTRYGSHSQLETVGHFEEDITKIIRGEETKAAQDSSQGSDDSSPFASECVRALLERSMSPQTPPPFTTSSGEGTPIRKTLPIVRRRKPSNEPSHSSEFSSLVSPRHLPVKRHPVSHYASANDTHHVPDTVSSSSTLSSIGRATMSSSQASFSETLGDEFTSRESSQRSINKYSRYERRCRSADTPLLLDEQSRDSNDKDSTDKSQDSTVTLEPTDSTDVRTESNDTEYLNGGSGNNIVAKVTMRMEEKRQILKLTHKHTDSGIEESNVSETKTDSGIIESTDGIEDEEEDIPLPDESKALRSYTTIFASRESGLADSPDPYVEEDSKSLPVVGYPRRGSHVEMVIATDGSPPKLLFNRAALASMSSDGTFDIGPGIAPFSELSGDYDTNNRNSSKYMTRKRQDSGASLGSLGSIENPLYEGTPESLNLANFSEEPGRVSPEVFTKPSETPSQAEQNHKHILGDNTSERGTPPKRKQKKRRVRPALRVLRITPSLPVFPSHLHNSELANHNDEDSQSSDEDDRGGSDASLARIRMMSPEEIAAQFSEKSRLKRSQSHDLLDNTDNSIDTTRKYGALYVVPELKSGRKNKTIHVQSVASQLSPRSSPQPSQSPTVLIDVDSSRRVSLDSLGNPRSPRNRKKTRTPQFV